MSPEGLISANRKQRLVSGVRALHRILVKPEPATSEKLRVLKTEQQKRPPPPLRSQSLLLCRGLIYSCTSALRRALPYSRQRCEHLYFHTGVPGSQKAKLFWQPTRMRRSVSDIYRFQQVDLTVWSVVYNLTSVYMQNAIWYMIIWIWILFRY